MSSNANDGRFRFISDLELGFEGIKGPNYPASSIPELATTQSYVFALTPAEKNHFQGNYAAAVSASGIHSFLPGVTQQQQQDVLNSNLLAQLAANATAGVGSDRDMERWHSKYTETLRAVGWRINNPTFAHIQVSSEFESASVLILNRASSYLDGPQLASFKATFQALAAQSNLPMLQIFERSSTAGKLANFQLGVVSNNSGSPSLVITYSYYNSSSEIPSALFYQWNKTVQHIQTGNQTAVLDSSVYDQVRQLVIDKLGRNAAALIQGLNISGPI